MAIVLHYLELIKIRLERKILYQLLEVLFLYLQKVIQFSDQLKMTLISQLVKDISRVI